jgi:hypothetical protein
MQLAANSLNCDLLPNASGRARVGLDVTDCGITQQHLALSRNWGHFRFKRAREPGCPRCCLRCLVDATLWTLCTVKTQKMGSFWVYMEVYGPDGFGCGRRGGDRTHNPRLRRPVLYPIELLARAL